MFTQIFFQATMKRASTEWALGTEEGRAKIKEKIIVVRDRYTRKSLAFSTAGVEADAKV